MHGKKCGTITPATDSWKTKSIWLCGQFSPTVVNYGLICLHWSLIFLLTELWDPTLTNVSSGFQLALVKSHHADTGLTATFCISLSNRADQFSFQAHFPAEKQSDFSTAGTGMASLTDEAWSPKSQMPSAHAWVRQLHGTTFRRPASCTGAWACLKGKVKARTHTKGTLRLYGLSNFIHIFLSIMYFFYLYIHGYKNQSHGIPKLEGTHKHQWVQAHWVQQAPSDLYKASDNLCVCANCPLFWKTIFPQQFSSSKVGNADCFTYTEFKNSACLFYMGIRITCGIDGYT